MTEKESMDIIKDMNLSDKERMEIAHNIILDEALSTGINAITNLSADVAKVIEHCYRD